MNKYAKDLTIGDVINIKKQGEYIVGIARTGNSIVIETNYTQETGGAAYKFDKMFKLSVYSIDPLVDFINKQIDYVHKLKQQLSDSPQSLQNALQYVKGYTYGYLQGQNANGDIWKLFCEKFQTLVDLQ